MKYDPSLLAALIPDVIAGLVLVVTCFRWRQAGRGRVRVAWGAAAALVLALALELWLGAVIHTYHGVYRQDRFALIVKAMVLGTGAVAFAAHRSRPEAWTRLWPAGLAVVAGLELASSPNLLQLVLGAEVAVVAVALLSNRMSRPAAEWVPEIAAPAGLALIGAVLLLAAAGTGDLNQLATSLRRPQPSLLAEIGSSALVAAVAWRVLLGPTLRLPPPAGSASDEPILFRSLGGGLLVVTQLALLARLLPALAQAGEGWSLFAAGLAALMALILAVTVIADRRSGAGLEQLRLIQVTWVLAVLTGRDRPAAAAVMFMIFGLALAGAALPLAGTRAATRLPGWPDQLQRGARLALTGSLLGAPPLAGGFALVVAGTGLAAGGRFWLLAILLLAWSVSAGVTLVRAWGEPRPAPETRVRLGGPAVAIWASAAGLVAIGLLASPIQVLARQAAQSGWPH